MPKKTLSNIKKTPIPGLYIVKRPTYKDNRGFFHEIYRSAELKKLGVEFKPVQLNHSLSYPKVIRAIHTEKWQKLVYPLTGKIFSAFVDVRSASKTFGKVYTAVFNNEDVNSPHTAVFIPPGVGNSICAVGNEPVHYVYAVDQEWEDSKAQGIAWDDPDLNIKWPVNNPIISDRDKNNPMLRELFPDKFK